MSLCAIDALLRPMLQDNLVQAQRSSPGYQWSGTVRRLVVARYLKMAQLSGITCACAHCDVHQPWVAEHGSGAQAKICKGAHLVPGHKLQAGHLPQRVDLQEFCSPLGTLQSW